jgi:hypothetical protein
MQVDPELLAFIARTLQNMYRSRDPIYVFQPYESHGCLVFDDPAHGLYGEELCEGADTLVRNMAARHAQDRPYLVCLSEHPLPARTENTWLRTDGRGWHHYSYFDHNDECQSLALCPSLNLYYPSGPPATLYVKVLPVPVGEDDASESPLDTVPQWTAAHSG